MKKIVICAVLMGVVAFAGFAYTEDAEMYKYIYNSVNTSQAQLDVLESMAQANLSGEAEFYAGALRNVLANYPNLKTSTEKWASSEQARLFAVLLGNEKYTDAAKDLWVVYDTFPDYPLVRADVLFALGKMQEQVHLPHVIRLLEDLNRTAPSGPFQRDGEEKLAFAAILSLEKYGDKYKDTYRYRYKGEDVEVELASGYVPVYMVSVPGSWYSDRVREQAKKTLPVIDSDPTEHVIRVIYSGEYDYGTKLVGLEAIDQDDQVSTENKAKIAVAALAEAWRLYPHNVIQKEVIAAIRTRAMNMLSRNKTDDASVYPFLERSYMYGFDQIEKREAVRALAAQGTDDAVTQLSKHLMELNDKRQINNIIAEDEDMAKAIIHGLAQAKRPLCKSALTVVARSISWSYAIKTLAQRALQEIGG